MDEMIKAKTKEKLKKLQRRYLASKINTQDILHMKGKMLFYNKKRIANIFEECEAVIEEDIVVIRIPILHLKAEVKNER